MAYGESNGHVTDESLHIPKGQVVTAICLGPNISKTAGDKHRCDKREKIIINVNKRVYSEKIVNVCKLKVNVHRA